MLQPNEMIIALSPSQIEAVCGAQVVVEYVNSLPAFKNMLEKGIGCLPKTDQLMTVWGDLQGIKIIVSKESSSIQQGRALERFQEYMTAEKIQRVKTTQYIEANNIWKKMEWWYAQNINIYARLWKDDQGKVDINKSDVDGWLREVYRAVFDQLYRVCIGIERNHTSGKTLKLRLCQNDKNCDNLILVNGPKVGGKGKKFCDNKCRNQFHARKGMRKVRGEEKRAVKHSHFAI